MSLELFRDRLNKSRLHRNDIKWMPNWFGEFEMNAFHPGRWPTDIARRRAKSERVIVAVRDMDDRSAVQRYMANGLLQHSQWATPLETRSQFGAFGQRP